MSGRKTKRREEGVRVGVAEWEDERKTGSRDIAEGAQSPSTAVSLSILQRRLSVGKCFNFC